MERSPAIDKNWEALKRLLAMLVGMAELGFGLGAGGQFTLFPQKDAGAQNQAQAEKSKLSPAFNPALSLPRHLHRAILKLLRPAESAARRLIIAAARGLVVTLPPFRPRKPKSKSVEPILRSLGIAVTMSNADHARAEAAKRAAAKRAARPRVLNLSLLDPLKNPFRVRRRHVPARSVPRIMSLDFDAQYRPLPAPPSPDDPVDAARLSLRLEALGLALDDLPGQAKRFARWKARNEAARARDRETRAAGDKQASGTVRFRRVSPLRRGRPPGGRLSRYDPTAVHPRNVREIDEILSHAHALAVYALESPDTS
ncbi:hypothetical protein RB623_00205 [Mesorhizobium sp. LHD-90]|uniref:hypothetical protein n=1 Tax=Mesorhizobium sp. LHD-90 TaxID=3071414 RepID=UPI0027DEDC00|nr:hypothetical protein [Mesorhizobium sp. LHD-90]MDQ6432470.1 hypothetical protein [Mesorhizobium sp. LHD-90]